MTQLEYESVLADIKICIDKLHQSDINYLAVFSDFDNKKVGNLILHCDYHFIFNLLHGLIQFDYKLGIIIKAFSDNIIHKIDIDSLEI